MKGKPSFLADEEEDYTIYDTDHVLERLYQQVNIKELFETCLRTEHRYSIKHEYEINYHFHPTEDYTKNAALYKELYIRFVHPMEEEMIHKLLIKFRLVNEGELFCSDFQYRFTDSNCQNYIGFLGKSNEDTVNEIKYQLD